MCVVSYLLFMFRLVGIFVFPKSFYNLMFGYHSMEDVCEQYGLVYQQNCLQFTVVKNCELFTLDPVLLHKFAIMWKSKCIIIQSDEYMYLHLLFAVESTCLRPPFELR